MLRFKIKVKCDDTRALNIHKERHTCVIYYFTSFLSSTSVCVLQLYNIVSGPPPPPLPPPLKAPNHALTSNKSFLHQHHQQFSNGNDEKNNDSAMVTNKVHDQNQQNNYHQVNSHNNNENIETIDSDSGLEVVEEPTLRPSDLVRGNHNRSMSIISGKGKI